MSGVVTYCIDSVSKCVGGCNGVVLFVSVCVYGVVSHVRCTVADRWADIDYNYLVSFTSPNVFAMIQSSVHKRKDAADKRIRQHLDQPPTELTTSAA